MSVLCKFTDRLQNKQAELLAKHTTDTKDSSPTRFLPLEVHRNYKVTFGRYRRCVGTEVIGMSSCLWTSQFLFLLVHT